MRFNAPGRLNRSAFNSDRAFTESISVTGTGAPTINLAWELPITVDATGKPTLVDSRIFLDIDGLASFAYSDGSVEFTAGEIITGGTTGTKATVVRWTLASGSWAAGTAAGTVWVREVI